MKNKVITILSMVFVIFTLISNINIVQANTTSVNGGSGSSSESSLSDVISGGDSAQVAVPIINLEENTLDININPNDLEKEYVFKVSNKEEDKISEVAMEYTLEINNANNLPVEFELYSCKSGVTDNTNLLDNNKTSKIKLGLNDEEQEYKLKIKWNQESKNYQYAKVIDYVQIVLNSSQID